MQNLDDPLSTPGYFWMAYNWSNLFFSCQICNQRHKKNLFPLSDPGKRVRNHHGDITDEDPQFVHPTDDDPEEFIGFRSEIAYAKSGNVRATISIMAFGLNRNDLCEKRRTSYKSARLLVDAVAQFREMADPEEHAMIIEIETHLQSLREKDAEFSSMMKALIAAL